MRLFLFLIFIGSISCVNQTISIPDEGIPLELAKYRSASISEIQYKLFFSIPESQKDSILAKEVILFDLTQPDNVVLDFSADPSNFIGAWINGDTVPVQLINQHIIIPEEFTLKGKNEMHIDFIAGDQSLNRNPEYLYTLFVPDRASTCFPVFDQPDMKATYELTLEIPETWDAVFNGPLISDTSGGNGQRRLTFGKSGPISSYLFAFTAGRFEMLEKEIEGRTMRMYHRENDSLKVARNSDQIFDLHSQSLNWLAEYTGIDYPFEKFDFALIPTFQYGGMEHPGAIFYRAGSLFLEESATLNQELGRASLIAHETAHMWFGDLVTMEWFSDVWMKEVFANFMAAKMVNPQFTEVNHDLRFLLSHYPGAYAIDRSEGRHPVRQELDNLKNAGTLYGSIIYQKAPIVMKQLESLIGTETMRISLAEYLKDYSYGNATWDDLVAIVDKNSTYDIKEWSSKWVYGSGIPEIKLWRSDSTVGIDHEGQWLNQRFNLMWSESKEYTSVLIDSMSVTVNDLYPDQVLVPNSDGIAYAYFSLGTDLLEYYSLNLQNEENDIVRGGAWINMYENVLRNEVLASDFMQYLIDQIPTEKNPLILNRMLGYAQSIYWRLLTDFERDQFTKTWEQLLVEEMESSIVKGARVMFFRTFRATLQSQESMDYLLSIHNGQKVIEGITIGESDMVNNALTLGLWNYKDSEFLIDQVYDSLKNPDRKARMHFVRKAVSPYPSERLEYFQSLLEPEMREQEPWVLEGLNYIFHPSRETETIDLIYTALSEIEEVQITGDIFFPKRWLDAVMGGHQSEEAAIIVDKFLNDNPGLSDNLKGKILQSADITKRAATIRKLSKEQL